MRHRRRLLRDALVALTLTLPAPLLAQQRTAPQPAAAARQAPSDSGYSSNEADFVAGKRVYLRSTRTFIGTITHVDDDHAFPPSFPRPRMKAVLMVRRDGPREWVPVERIGRIYVVKR